MNKASQVMFKILAIGFFLLALASVLATLFAASGPSRSPGLFLAVVFAGLGKWLLGKSQGKSARETFGRAIEVAESDDALESLQNGGMTIQKPKRNMADRISDTGKSSE